MVSCNEKSKIVLIYSFVCLFVRSCSFVHVRSFVRSFVHSFLCSFVHSFIFSVKFRILFAILGAFGMVIIYGFKVNLSVAIVAMVNHTAIKISNDKQMGNATMKDELLVCFESTEDIFETNFTDFRKGLFNVETF